jgi:hypothetical protein
VDGFKWLLNSNTLVFLLLNLFLLLPTIEWVLDSIPLLFLLIGVFLVCYNCSSHAFKACDSIIFVFLLMVNTGRLPNSISIVFLGGHLIQTCLFKIFQIFFNVFVIRWPMCFEFVSTFIVLLLVFSFCIIFCTLLVWCD